MRLFLALIALTWAPAFAQYRCSLCKGGAGLTKPDGMVTTRQGLTASCEALTMHVHSLHQEACEDLQQLAAGPCGCPGTEPAVVENEEPAEDEVTVSLATAVEAEAPQ